MIPVLHGIDGEDPTDDHEEENIEGDPPKLKNQIIIILNKINCGVGGRGTPLGGSGARGD